VATNQNNKSSKKPAPKPAPKPTPKTQRKPSPKPAPKQNKNQGFFSTAQSLLPGGKPANWSAARQNVTNIAREVSGVADFQRAATEAAKGNYLGAFGNAALGALGFVPGVGWVAKGGAKVTQAAVKGAVKGATKVSPKVTQTVVGKVTPTVNKVAPTVTRVTGPVGTVAGKVNKLNDRLTSSVVRPLRTKVDDLGPIRQQPGIAGKIKTAGLKTANLATSPFVLASLGSGIYTGVTNTAFGDGGTTYQTREPGQYPKGGGQGLQINTQPPSGGGGGGGGTGPETPGTPNPEDAAPPILEVPDMGGEGEGEGGGIDVGGGYGEDMFGTGIETGGGASFLGGGGEMGLPGGVAKANLQYAADQAAQRAQNRINDAAIREAFAQGIMGVRGQAADIIGGRSAAIRGQGVTGQRRDYQVGQAAEAQRFQGESNALARTYGEAVNEAYQQAAAQIADRARTKSEAAAQIRRMG